MFKVRTFLTSIAMTVAALSYADVSEDAFNKDLTTVKEALEKVESGSTKEAAEASVKLAEDLGEKKDYEAALKALEKAAEELKITLSDK
jgi:predicted negative regulator of RcsB-dependent stress response